MEGPYRFALQCVCKIERLFSVNVIRTSCLEVATSARVWAGAIILVLACELAQAAYASEGCSSSASGEPAVEASADAPVSSEAVHPENGWEYDAASNQWFYYQNSAPAKGWLYTGGFWYWFDNEGVMAVGLTECAGGRYLLNAGDDASIPYGAMRLGWVACDDGWRFFNASGAMERCWLLDGSNWYWLDPETGIMATGATQCGSGSYCFGASGAMAFGWAYDRGTWYYADSSGELQSGWLHKWGAWYWLDPSTKAMATGLVNDGSSLYAMDASGAMETGWALVDGAWYHAAGSGVLDVGWYWDGSQWYWLDLETRAMATGEFEAYGDHYYALTDGAIQMSGWAPCGEGLALLRSNGAVIFVAGKNASGAPVVQSGAQSTVRGDSLAFGIHRHLCRPNSATDRTVVAQARIDARKAHHATSDYGRAKLFCHDMTVARAARPREGESRCVVGDIFRHKIGVTSKAAGRDNRLLRIDAIGRFEVFNVRTDNAAVLYNEVCHLAVQANVNTICGRNLC